MPWTGVGVYVPVRDFGSVAGAVALGGSVFAAAFLGAGALAMGFFFAAVFFAAVAPAFFFIFMGRTVQQPPVGGQAGGRGVPA